MQSGQGVKVGVGLGVGGCAFSVQATGETFALMSNVGDGEGVGVSVLACAISVSGWARATFIAGCGEPDAPTHAAKIINMTAVIKKEIRMIKAPVCFS